MAPNSPFKTRKYDVGRSLLSLRTKTRLTQAELGALVGVSKRSIQHWEGGEAYPKEEHLRRLIAVCVERGMFIAGRERDEALNLWQLVSANAPQRLALFDTAWFDTLVAPPAAAAPPSATRTPLVLDHAPSSTLVAMEGSGQVDWGEAVDVPDLYGREAELATLDQWVVAERCRVVALLGMGGIGKTSLSIAFARQAVPCFDAVIWRSLRNAPPLSQLLDSLIRFVSAQQQAALPQSVADKLALLLNGLRERRCLIVLDNLETLLQEGLQAGHYHARHAEYGLLVQRLGETPHQSCLLLTSREKPRELGPQEGRTAPVRTLALRGLAERACQDILADRDVTGTAADWASLIHRYGGNPLALKLVSEPIREIFGGDIRAFLANEGAIFGGIRYLLDQQFERLSLVEQDLLYWLAIGREPVGIETLRTQSMLPVGPRERLEAIEALRRRFLIERGESGPVFTLQPVVLEYVTERLIGHVLDELIAGRPDYLRRYGLMQAQAPEYVRQSQERIIVQPLLAQLMSNLKTPPAVEAHLQQTLAAVRALSPTEQGYGGGNILNLLTCLGRGIRGYDFSGLHVWQAYLADVELHDVNFSGADLTGAVFTDTFRTIVPVAFSPDGRYMAAGSINGDIWLWHVADRQQIALFQNHTGPIYAIAFSPNGEILASGSGDGLIMLWSVASGMCLAIFSGHSSRVWSVAFRFDGMLLASSSDDLTIKLWEVATGECAATLSGHRAPVASVAFSPDGTLLASGSHAPDPVIKLWDMSTALNAGVASGACVATLAGHTADIWSVAFHPDGTLLASGGADLTIKLWALARCTCVATLGGHTARIRSVAWSPDGTTLASGSLDQTVKVWDTSTVLSAGTSSGTCLATLAENTGPVNGVAFSPDGDTLAGGGELQAIALWSVTRKECLAMLYGYNNGILAMAFSSDGTTLASAGFDRMIRLWRVGERAAHARLVGHTSAVYSLAFSPDGALVVSGGGGGDRTVRLWAVARPTCLATFGEHSGPVMAVAWSPDGRTIASGSLDRTLKLWSLTSPTSLATLRGHDDAVRAVAFSPDGKLLASASYDRTIRVWAVDRRALEQTFAGHTAPVRAVTFGPDGGLVASGSADQTIRLWAMSSGACLATLSGHSGEVVSVAFSPDGVLLASGSFDGTVRLWAVGDGACLATLSPHAGVVYALAFSPDGCILASGGAEGLITLWDVPTRQPVTSMRSDGPYARMRIDGVTGLTDAQKATLRALGAIDAEP